VGDDAVSGSELLGNSHEVTLADHVKLTDPLQMW
jgi:hypothetical protein